MMASLAAGGGMSVPSSDGTMEEGTPAPTSEGKHGSNLERNETEQGMCVPSWECEAASAAMSTARDGGKTDTLQEQQMGKTSINTF